MKRLLPFGPFLALAAGPLFLSGCLSSSPGDAPPPIATGVLEVGVSGGLDAIYFLRLSDGNLLGLDLSHMQETRWPGTEDVIRWRTAGGSRVLVYGTRDKDGRIVVDSMEPPSSPVGTTESALGTAGVGERRLLAVQVQYDGHASMWTPNQIKAALDDTAAHFSESSFGKMHLSYDLADPVDVTFGSCNAAYDWLNQARAQVKAKGMNPDGYDHIMLIGRPTTDCGWAGLGMQPGNTTWITWVDAGVMVHELGHNLGLWHASSLTCDGGKQPMSDPSSCKQDEYGDPFDPMGNGGVDHHYNGRAKVSLGWIPAQNTATASVNKDYTLAPITQEASGLQLLGVKGPGDIMYQVEFRKDATYDPISPSAPLASGVLIHAFYTQAQDSARARLLDMVPGGTFKDAPLTVGHAYTFYGTTTRIHVESVSPAGALVHLSDANGGGGGGGGTATAHLMPLHSGKCVGVAGGSTKRGAHVVQWICNGATDQQWSLQDLGNGEQEIQDAKSGLCLDVHHSSTMDGTPIVQSTCHGSPNQRWRLVDNGDGTTTVRSVLSDKCLDVYGGSTADGAAVIEWACHSGTNQRFKIQ